MNGKSHLVLLRTAVSFLALVAASPAFACGNGKLLFEEKFAAIPAWIAASPEKSVGPNGLTIAESAGDTTWYQGPPEPFGNAEFCVTVSAQASGSDLASAGIAFRGFNADNYYRVAVNNISGEFNVIRRQAGQWIVIIPDAASPAIRKGPTAENEVSVKMSGIHALISVNDTPVAELNAPAAFVNDKRQNYVNVIWISYPSTKPSYTFIFKNFQVREAQ